MNCTLTRTAFKLYGIFGDLRDESGKLLAITLEHAYSDGAAFVPKLAPGKYECVKHSPHRLPYETIMVTNVPDFQGSPVSGILIHIGNYNGDSEGCILLGLSAGTGCILESRHAFESFMELQKDSDKFTLTVT